MPDPIAMPRRIPKKFNKKIKPAGKTVWKEAGPPVPEPKKTGNRKKDSYTVLERTGKTVTKNPNKPKAVEVTSPELAEKWLNNKRKRR